MNRGQLALKRGWPGRTTMLISLDQQARRATLRIRLATVLALLAPMACSRETVNPSGVRAGAPRDGGYVVESLEFVRGEVAWFDVLHAQRVKRSACPSEDGGSIPDFTADGGRLEGTECQDAADDFERSLEGWKEVEKGLAGPAADCYRLAILAHGYAMASMSFRARAGRVGTLAAGESDLRWSWQLRELAQTEEARFRAAGCARAKPKADGTHEVLDW